MEYLLHCLAVVDLIDGQFGKVEKQPNFKTRIANRQADTPLFTMFCYFCEFRLFPAIDIDDDPQFIVRSDLIFTNEIPQSLVYVIW